MATRNSTTPSGGIFRSQLGVPHGFGNPDGKSLLGGLIGFGPTQYTGRERLEQFGADIMLHVPGARTPVRQDPRPYMELLSDIAYGRRLQIPSGMERPRGAFVPSRTQLPQRPQSTQPSHQPMH